MWWLALVGCEEELGTQHQNVTVLCDGCGPSEPTSTTIEPVPGLVSLVQVFPDGGGYALEVFEGASDEHLGRTLVDVGDVDGDGLRDVWASGFGDVLGSDADGRRLARIASTPEPIGDLDGDGAMDLALPSVAAIIPGADLRLGGTFETGAWRWSGRKATPYTAPDLDGDGLPETTWIRTSDVDPEKWEIDLLSGALASEGFSSDRALAAIHAEEGGGGTFDLGDIDADGVGDLGIVEVDGEGAATTLTLHLWSGADLANGRISRLGAVVADHVGVGASFEVVRLGDRDGDGAEDLAVAVFERDDGSVALWSGRELRGSRTVDDGLWLRSDATGVQGVDLDGDGLAELLVSTTSLAEVFRGDGPLAPAVEAAWSWTPGAATRLAGLDAEGSLLAWMSDPLPDP